MATHNKLGQKGEDLAVKYLDACSYKVIATNYRFSHAEVDIIARKDDILVFVEVKTRSSERHGQPEWSITEKKVELLMDAAYHYMNEIGYDWEIRFDVISIILDPDRGPKLNHLKDAFVP